MGELIARKNKDLIEDSEDDFEAESTSKKVLSDVDTDDDDLERELFEI